ncbi:succinate dehydrogenase assembly factor 3, mitochondrial [Chelonus insularis]|uniref:succinate dehydrogenase assembly factor 3, mitochondrial n=1 Tax=Chelonus insularis TaxID=460826 RepID=UPI00158AD5BC|nr:succinate dehydrogenase assembly factor 3, mitochondrial [Chelonus insularis]
MTSTTSHLNRVRILYKTILRLHRGMPTEIQSLGNNYVRDEFRRHKNCNEIEANIFMNEWTDYAISLAQQLGLKGPISAKPLGKNLQTKTLDELRDEQVYQLYELMLAATGKSKNEKH